MLRRGKLSEVDPSEAQRRAREGATLVDVREPDEWEAGHAPEATHVPLGSLSAALDRLQGEVVLAICRSGRRSASAVKALQKAGIEAHNVAGGMNAWQAAGLPVTRDDGSPGTVA